MRRGINNILITVFNLLFRQDKPGWGIWGIFFWVICSYSSYGQSPMPPPNRLQVYATQELSFGSFSTGSSGGTVIISPTGNRSVTGTVIEFMLSVGNSAIFEVRLIQGRMVHILLPTQATLTRVGSGEIMTITDFTTDKPGNGFVTTAAHPFFNTVTVGATLHVGNISSNPPGNYSGTFPVTFIQE
ncbi:MAG: DUF4402 domain-containing protein [Mariniphaga sp.]